MLCTFYYVLVRNDEIKILNQYKSVSNSLLALRNLLIDPKSYWRIHFLQNRYEAALYTPLINTGMCIV